MPHPIRTAALGLVAALCAAVIAALGIGVSPSAPSAHAQSDPIATSLTSSGVLTVDFADKSDGRFPAGVTGVKLTIDIEIDIQQRLTGSGAAMRAPVLQIDLGGDGATFDDNLGGGNRRTIPLSLSSSETSCTSRGVSACIISLDREGIQVPALRLQDDAEGTITVDVTLSGFGLHRPNQPSVAFAAPELEALSFSDSLEIAVGTTERTSDPRLHISFPDDSDDNVSAGVGTDGQGRARVGLSLEFTLTGHTGETVANPEVRLDSYGRVEVPRLLGSAGLEVEKAGLGGLSTGACQRVSQRSNRWRCELTGFTANALVPRDIALDSYTVSGNARVLGLTFSYDVTESGATYSESRTWDDFSTAPATRTLTVSDAREVDSATLRLVDGQPSIIAANVGQTRLRLSILNENGGPSHPRQILLIFITTSRGSLRLADGATCGHVCTLTSEQLADFGPGDTAAIDFILSAAGSAIASVKATVNPVVGGGTITTEPLEIAFSGAASTIRLAAPGSSLHHRSGGAPVTITADAIDANGIEAAVPRLQFNILDPDGELVSVARIDVKQKNDEIILTTLETSDDGLTPGVYTLRARSGSMIAEQVFTVSGPPARIAVTTNPPAGTRIGQIIAITATITDARSAPIADGLTVGFQPINNQSFFLVGDGQESTAGGRATTYIAISRGGTGVLAISAGDQVNIASLRSNAPERDASSPLVSDKTPDGRAVWLAATNVSTQFVPRLRDAGILGLWIRSDNEWIGYAVDGGQRVPGSVQFAVRTGQVVYPIP